MLSFLGGDAACCWNATNCSTTVSAIISATNWFAGVAHATSSCMLQEKASFPQEEKCLVVRELLAYSDHIMPNVQRMKE